MTEKILPQDQQQNPNIENHHDLEVNHTKPQDIHPTI